MTGGSLWLFYPHYFAFVFCGKVDIKSLMYKLHQTTLFRWKVDMFNPEWIQMVCLDASGLSNHDRLRSPNAIQRRHSENQKTEDLPFGSQHGWRWRSVFPPCFATIYQWRWVQTRNGGCPNWWCWKCCPIPPNPSDLELFWIVHTISARGIQNNPSLG